MVRLTLELIESAQQSTNPLKDRELDLRGYKIPILENLGATLDQFDAIDFSDNELRKLDGFPQLKRLKALILHNNKIVRIAEGLDQFLPNLTTVVLTNNNLTEFKDLDPLACFKNLEMLTVTKNPVSTKPNYRLYCIYKIPQVRILDYRRVKLKEREQATAIFRGKARAAAAQKDDAKTFVPGAPVENKVPDKQAPVRAVKRPVSQLSSNYSKASGEDLQAIREAIRNAKTLEEVERLNQLLCSGQFSGFAAKQAKIIAENDVDIDK